MALTSNNGITSSIKSSQKLTAVLNVWKRYFQNLQFGEQQPVMANRMDITNSSQKLQPNVHVAYFKQENNKTYYKIHLVVKCIINLYIWLHT